MKKVYIVSFDAKSRKDEDPGMLVDEHFAVTADEDNVLHLVEVVPTEWPDVFRAAERCNYIPIATGGKTVAYITRAIETLQSMSAYTLLTDCYMSNTEGEFDVMHPKQR